MLILTHPQWARQKRLIKHNATPLSTADRPTARRPRNQRVIVWRVISRARQRIILSLLIRGISGKHQTFPSTFLVSYVCLPYCRCLFLLAVPANGYYFLCSFHLASQPNDNSAASGHCLPLHPCTARFTPRQHLYTNKVCCYQ